MKNKKAQIAATITWVIASLIIVFILAIYLSAVYFMGLKKTVYGEDERVGIANNLQDHLLLQQKFLLFLNSPVEFDNEEFLVKNLIISEPETGEEKFEKFQELVEKFMDENIMEEDYPVDVVRGRPKRAWFRLYALDEEVKQYSSHGDGIKYMDYEVYRGTSRARTYPCNPDDYRGGSILLYLINGNKKITMCVEYEI
jgi:hypothetical protein